MELYWLHCTGPDGPCVLLATQNTRTGAYYLVDDGREAYPSEDEKGQTWVHKWILLRREKIERPKFSRT